MNDEKTLWSGKTPVAAQTNQLIKFFFIAWMLIFIPPLIAELLYPIFFPKIYVDGFNLFIYFFYLIIIIPEIIIFFYLVQMYNKYKLDRKITYKITSEKIEGESSEKSAILLLKDLIRCDIKKNILDIKEMDTGSLFFYSSKSKTPTIRFNHIEQVEKIGQILNELMPTLKIYSKRASLPLNKIEKNEKEIWAGKPSLSILRVKFLRYSAFSLIIYNTIVLYVLGAVLASLLSYPIIKLKPFVFLLFLVFSALFILLKGVFEIQGAKRTRYIIGSKTLARKSKKRFEEILLSEIAGFKIVKKFWDSDELQTRSILFYNTTWKRLRINFQHIEHVSEVKKILYELAPYLRDLDNYYELNDIL